MLIYHKESPDKYIIKKCVFKIPAFSIKKIHFIIMSAKCQLLCWKLIVFLPTDHSGYGLSQWDDVTMQRHVSLAEPIPRMILTSCTSNDDNNLVLWYLLDNWPCVVMLCGIHNSAMRSSPEDYPVMGNPCPVVKVRPNATLSWWCHEMERLSTLLGNSCPIVKVKPNATIFTCKEPNQDLMSQMFFP